MINMPTKKELEEHIEALDHKIELLVSLLAETQKNKEAVKPVDEWKGSSMNRWVV